MNCRVERNIDGAPVSVKQGEYQDLKNRAQFSDIEFISALAKVAEDDISELGSGDFGTAYSLGDGRVAKLTSSRGEAEVSLRQMQIQAEGAVKIHEVYRDGRSYVIIQEEVDTDSSIEDDFGLLLNLLASQNLPIQYLNYLDYDELSEEDKSDYDSIEDFIQGIENVNWAYRQLGVEASDIKYDNLGYNEQGELVAFDLDDRRGDRNTPFEGDIKTAMEVIHENEFRNTSSEMSSIEAEKFHIIERAKKYGTYLKAPNGAETNLSPEQWVETRTTAFKEWFGDWELDPDNASKVVDENGEPKVMYHGGARFNTFDQERINPKDRGFYFTDNIHTATDIYALDTELVARDRDNYDYEGVPEEMLESAQWDEKYFKYAEVKRVFLNIRNPRYADGYHASTLRKIDIEEHDGIISRNTVDYGTGGQYVVKSSNQVKSATDNVGTYSKESDDIRYKKETEGTETLNRLLTKKEIKKLVGRLKETGLASMVIIDTQKMTDYLETIYGEDFIIEDIMENESKEEIKQLKTKQGTTFGFVTPNGDIYLDPTALTAEVPIHEFTHLWNQYIYETRPELWEDIIEVAKQTVMWDKVANSTQYKEQFKGKEGQDLTDAIADEVWAQIVGIQGQQVWGSILDETEGNRTVLQQILEVLQEYWESVLEVFNFSTKDIVNEREGTPIGKREQSVFSDMENIDSLYKYVDITLRELLQGRKIGEVQEEGKSIRNLYQDLVNTLLMNTEESSVEGTEILSELSDDLNEYIEKENPLLWEQGKEIFSNGDIQFNGEHTKLKQDYWGEVRIGLQKLVQQDLSQYSIEEFSELTLQEVIEARPEDAVSPLFYNENTATDRIMYNELSQAILHIDRAEGTRSEYIQDLKEAGVSEATLKWTSRILTEGTYSYQDIQQWISSFNSVTEVTATVEDSTYGEHIEGSLTVKWTELGTTGVANTIDFREGVANGYQEVIMEFTFLKGDIPTSIPYTLLSAIRYAVERGMDGVSFIQSQYRHTPISKLLEGMGFQVHDDYGATDVRLNETDRKSIYELQARYKDVPTVNTNNLTNIELKHYASKVIEGKSQVAYLNSKEEDGRRSAGKFAIQATLELARNAQESETTSEGRRQRLALLEELARENGVLIQDSDFPNLLGDKLDGGAESDVYYSEKTKKVYKLFSLTFTQSDDVLKTIDKRIVLHNYLFKNTNIRLVGMVEGTGQMVLEQRAINIIPIETFMEAKDRAIELETYLETKYERQLTWAGGQSFNLENEYVLDDVRPANFVKAVDGNFYAIDVMVNKLGHDMSSNYYSLIDNTTDNQLHELPHDNGLSTHSKTTLQLANKMFFENQPIKAIQEATGWFKYGELGWRADIGEAVAKPLPTDYAHMLLDRGQINVATTELTNLSQEQIDTFGLVDTVQLEINSTQGSEYSFKANKIDERTAKVTLNIPGEVTVTKIHEALNFNRYKGIGMQESLENGESFYRTPSTSILTELGKETSPMGLLHYHRVEFSVPQRYSHTEALQYLALQTDLNIETLTNEIYKEVLPMNIASTEAARAIPLDILQPNPEVAPVMTMIEQYNNMNDLIVEYQEAGEINKIC